MKVEIPQISIGKIVNIRFLATLFVVVMSVFFLPLERTAISPVKVGLMSLSVFIFVFRVPYISKALIWGILYWSICLLCALLQEYIRFSTVGYLGMFIIFYITYYNLVYFGAFTFSSFIKLLQGLIIAYGVILILQQIALLIGFHSLPPINLVNQQFLALTKLPSLSMEPSHSARILTVLMLSYLRCIELTNNGVKPSIKTLFNVEHRWVTILFLWAMLTMGSGTAFVGLGLLCLYFIQWRTFIYVIPLLIGFLFCGQALKFEQMDRVLRVTKTTITGNAKEIQVEDGSAATRIIPIINTIKIDLSNKQSWFGNGTSSYEKASTGWMRTTDKIAIVEQYGLIAFIVSLILVYTCVIHDFFSIETLVFLILFGMSLTNIYYVWGTMMIFTAVRYFQIQDEKGILITNNELYESN
ncbi:uncharacterized protein BN686_02353 [Tannerella sp. CAG:51]|uniref:hypothetical protein n=1 Tax=Coprobacter fastidiosus TaxID=1099853 RepID=UPI0003382332|nr:hypothetical protein [Coprobacter fastidiosus]CDD89886.1 uncharacterized protein BN686_02353 [Tannerella sp. CAG:51]